CREAYAVVLSGSMATYSGSRLAETGKSVLTVGPKTRTSGWRVSVPPCSQAWKPAVRTASWAGAARVVGSVTTLTEPSGSMLKSSDGSPSLATTAMRPSGVKATLSGSAPTWTAPSHSSVVASAKASHPGSVLVGASTATTTRPSARTSTELATVPSGSPAAAEVARLLTFAGAVASVVSSTSV